MLATDGGNAWLQVERGRGPRSRIKDARQDPIHYAGFQISLEKGPRRGVSRQAKDLHRWHVRTSLNRHARNEPKAYFLDLAVRRSEDTLRESLWNIPYEPYEPYAAVRTQWVGILNAVNRARKRAGYSQVPYGALRFRRWIFKVFAEPRLLERTAA